MKLIVKITFAIISVFFGVYLLLPTKYFPTEPLGAVVSNEPADVEEFARRGYFTNFTRKEVISHYESEYRLNLFGLNIYPVRLNYPPEDSKTLIRDQTRSTFLEELVFPFRESIFINGFEPKEDKDAVVVNGVRYRQKIIVKHNVSDVAVRFILGMLTVLFSYLFCSGFYTTITKFAKKYNKK